MALHPRAIAAVIAKSILSNGGLSIVESVVNLSLERFDLEDAS
jgi:hypothetical protein